MLCFALAGTATAAGRGGSHHGGFHHGGSHHGGFHRFGCCFGPALVGGLFLGTALAAPFYAYPYPYAYSYPPYPAYAAPVYAPPPTYAPQASIQREVCYPGGCYRLQGDGVTVAYQWVWYPAVPPPPPALPRS